MMNRYPNPNIEMLQVPELSKDCDIFHFVTTRHGGVSKGNYATFNLGEYAGDDPENVRTNRQILSDAIGIDPERLLVPHQIQPRFAGEKSRIGNHQKRHARRRTD